MIRFRYQPTLRDDLALHRLIMIRVQIRAGGSGLPYMRGEGTPAHMVQNKS